MGRERSGRARLAIAIGVAGAALAAIMAGISAPALAAADPSLEVTGVQGRTVDLVMTFDPQAAIAPDSPTSASLEVGGVVVPADSRLVVAQGDGPNTAVLVLDTSGSMKGDRITAAREAATSFVEALPEGVSVGLVTFSDAARVVVAPTEDRAAVISAIDSVAPDGSTALFDSIPAALSSLPPSAQARLVLLSDGEDTASSSALASVSREAKRAGVPIDVVALAPTPDQLAALTSLADVTGGTLRTATESGALLGAFLEASRTFGAKAFLTATLPDDVDGRAQPVTAMVIVGSLEFAGGTTLPASESLAPRRPVDIVTPAIGIDVVEAAGGPSRTPILLALLASACVLAFGWVVLRSRRTAAADRRLDQILNYRAGPRASADPNPGEPGHRSRVQSIDDFLARSKGYRGNEELLATAAVDLTPGGWLVIRIAVSGALMIVMGLLTGSFILSVIVGGLVGWLATLAWINSRRTARRRMFSDDLPDFLMLLASGLRAGLSFNNALESAASDGKGEVGRQMRRALRAVQVGVPLDTALMDCAERMDSEDLRWTVTALSIQQQVGGNLSTILDAAARTIRARHELRREVRTLSAEGRLSAYILVALPVLVFCFLAVFRPDYISKLWLDPLGLVMLVGLSLSMLAGWLWMRVVVRIEV